MLPQIEQLLILQDKDQHLRRFQADLKKMPADAERAKARMLADQQALAAAKEAMQLNEIAIRNIELQIGTRRQTIVRLKTQQFETRKNDEFTALGYEAVRYTEEVSKLEDEQLVLMEKGEGLKAVLEEAQKALETTKAVASEDLAKVKERYVHVMAQIKEFEALRAAQAAKIDPDLVARYDRLVNAKDDAVVALHGQVCRGCNMKVTAATYNAARAEREFAFCPNCGRMVYVSAFED